MHHMEVDMPDPHHEKLRWKPLLLEAFFVVLGVVLALAANEWREQHNQQQHAVVALESIRSELAENKQAIEAALTYHYHLMDTLGSLVQQAASAEVSPFSYPDGRLFSQGYTAPATLLSTAWDAANATDAVTNMDYDEVLLLSRIYEEQRRYEQQTQVSGQLIYEKLFKEGHAGIRRNYANLHSLISAFWYSECELLASYQEVQGQLEGENEAKTQDLPEGCQYVLRR